MGENFATISSVETSQILTRFLCQHRRLNFTNDLGMIWHSTTLQSVGTFIHISLLRQLSNTRHHKVLMSIKRTWKFGSQSTERSKTTDLEFHVRVLYCLKSTLNQQKGFKNGI